MVVLLEENNSSEINFLKNHPLGPRMSNREIAAYLKYSESDVERALKNCEQNDFGGSEQELYWLQNHPLGPKYTDDCRSAVKIAFNIVYNFIVLMAIRICEQMPLAQEIFNTISNYYLQIVDVVSDYASDEYDTIKHDNSTMASYYNSDEYFNNITNDLSNNESHMWNVTAGDAWQTADLNDLEVEYQHEDEITMWKNEFLEVFPVPEIVHEMYDANITSEKHQMNMILASMETHLTNGYQNETPTSVMLIRAKHYRQCFVQMFPVTMDDFLLDMVYTTELTFERHIDMLRLALRAKYSR